jgi:hypothetical protein
MPKGTTTCNNILALIYNATAWANIADNAASSPITNIYMALATASYSASDNASADETVYTNYVRQTVARSVAGWTAPSGGATSNAAAIEYPQCGVTGATITSACTAKATGASEIFHYGDLNSPIAVSNQIQPRFPIGAVTVTEA